MQRWRQMPREPQGENPDQKRRTGRISHEGVKCNLGKVLDLSAGVVRVSGRGPKPGNLGDGIMFKLDWGLDSMAFRGRIMRLERKAIFGWVAGSSFENITPAQKQALSKASMLAASGEITDWHRAG